MVLPFVPGSRSTPLQFTKGFTVSQGFTYRCTMLFKTPWDILGYTSSCKELPVVLTVFSDPCDRVLIQCSSGLLPGLLQDEPLVACGNSAETVALWSDLAVGGVT